MENPQVLIAHSQEAKQLYRSFSFEVESQITDKSPQNELKRAVVEDRKREDERQKQLAEWRKHFERRPVSEWGAFNVSLKGSSPLTSGGDSEPEIAKLDVESNELTKAWALLREKLPSDQQINFPERPQEVGDVISLVHQMGDEWQVERQKGVSSRAKASFRRMYSRLNSHSNLLKILPLAVIMLLSFAGRCTHWFR